MDEYFDDIRKVFLEYISENMASFGQTRKYGAINAADTTTMGYFIVKYVYDASTIHEDMTTKWQVSKAGELKIISEYLITMKA